MLTKCFSERERIQGGRARRFVLEKMAGVYADGKERVALGSASCPWRLDRLIPACAENLKSGVSAQRIIPSWFSAHEMALFRRSAHNLMMAAGKHLFPGSRPR